MLAVCACICTKCVPSTCVHFVSFSNSSKDSIGPRGAGSLWSLQNTQPCKSAVKNLRYRSQRHMFIPVTQKQYYQHPFYTNQNHVRGVCFPLLSCRLQLESLQFNRSQSSAELVRRFCLYRHQQHR